MTLQKSELESIMRRITEKLSSETNGNLRKIMLYGSYARGDFSENSDVDIMVLVDDPRPNRIYSIIRSDLNNLEDIFPIMISCHFQNHDHFYNAMNSTSFYKNIEREGVVYYDSTARH